MIARVNMDMYQGLPFTWYLPIYDPTGTVENLTGDTFTAIMGTTNGTTIETFATAVGLDDTGLPALVMTLTAAETLAIPVGIYRWDCIMSDSVTGDVLPIAVGDVSVMDMLSA